MTHLSENGVYLTENLEEPRKHTRHDFGLMQHGRDAVKAAENILGVKANPTDQRDGNGFKGVRSLASAVLRQAINRYSWPDIAMAIYGRRRHNMAREGAEKWKQRPELDQALDLFMRAQEKPPTRRLHRT